MARRVSQEELAARAGVSTRHLSCVETGKATVGREVLNALAGALDLPLRSRNEILHAAGFAPSYAARELDAPELAAVRRMLDLVLAAYEPFPAFAFDRVFDVVGRNAAALRLLERLEAPPPSPEIANNLVMAILHPGGWRSRIANWEAVASGIVERVHRAAFTGDQALLALRDRVLALPDVPARWRAPRPAEGLVPFVPIHLRHGAIELRLMSLLVTIGSPLDVTADELRIEMYLPADPSSEALLREWARA